VTVGIRPEHFLPTGEGHVLTGRVQVVEPLGSDTLIHFALGSATLTARVAPEMRPQPGEALTIGVDPSRVHLFDAATERAIH
jgi:multiple sugar transport system ATP-binding protein